MTSFDLERYVEAQKGTSHHSDYDTALSELKAEKKTTHWIWYVLPQLDGLGSSEMCRRYGIVSLEEAREYVAHPVLGPRLTEAMSALLDAEADTAGAILGEGDAVKLQSSLTLFQRADPQEPVFRDLLEKYYDGEEDPRTLALL